MDHVATRGCCRSLIDVINLALGKKKDSKGVESCFDSMFAVLVDEVVVIFGKCEILNQSRH